MMELSIECFQCGIRVCVDEGGITNSNGMTRHNLKSVLRVVVSQRSMISFGPADNSGAALYTCQSMHDKNRRYFLLISIHYERWDNGLHELFKKAIRVMRLRNLWLGVLDLIGFLRKEPQELYYMTRLLYKEVLARVLFCFIVLVFLLRQEIWDSHDHLPVLMPAIGWGNASIPHVM